MSTLHEVLWFVWVVACIACGGPSPDAAGGSASGSSAQAGSATSSKNPWDGTYQLATSGDEPNLCFMADHARTLTVSNGELSFPWFLAGRAPQDHHPLRAGRVDGVVHPDGTAVATIAFTNPYLFSSKPQAIELERQLDPIRSVSIAFSQVDGTRRVSVDVDVHEGSHCQVAWEARNVVPPPSAKPDRSRPTGHSPSRPAEPAPSQPTPAPSQPAPDPNRHSNCISSCWTTEDIGKSRCEEDESSCHSRCEQLDGTEHYTNDQMLDCLGRCTRDEDTCKDRCTQDAQRCESACP